MSIDQAGTSFTTEAKGGLPRLVDRTEITSVYDEHPDTGALSSISQENTPISISAPGVSSTIRTAADFAKNETSPDFMGPVMPPNIMQASKEDLIRVEVNQNIKAILDEMRTLNTEMKNMHTTVGTTTVDNTIAVERSAELVQLAVTNATNSNNSRLVAQQQVGLV